MTQRMNPEIRDQWVTALRSGEYRQGRERLGKTNYHGAAQFCCLGVLCEIAVSRGVIERYTDDPEPIESHENASVFVYGARRDSDWLPPAVMDWAGLCDHQGARVSDRVKANGEIPTLADLNDDGEPFAYIADLIEAQL